MNNKNQQKKRAQGEPQCFHEFFPLAIIQITPCYVKIFKGKQGMASVDPPKGNLLKSRSLTFSGGGGKNQTDGLLHAVQRSSY